MNEVLFAKQNADLPDNVYDLSPFLRERLWENSDYFHYGEDEVREFGNLVSDLFINVKISSDDTSDQVLKNIRNYLSNKNITGSDEGLILSLIEGGLQIAHDALAERLKLIKALRKELRELEEELIESRIEDPEAIPDIRNEIREAKSKLEELLEKDDFDRVLKILKDMELINIENRNAGEEEAAFIQAEVAEVPADVRVSVQAKLAAVLDLSPEEVIRVVHEDREAAA